MKRSLGLFALGAMITACSSTPVTTTDGGLDSGTQPPPDSGKPKDSGANPCSTCAAPIDGATDMTVTVQEFVFGGMAAPLAGVDVRVENASGCFVDGTTDAGGVAHIKVDPAKGPFDITAAKVGYVALSVLNQAGPLATPMIVNKADSSALFSSYKVSGTIAGKKNAANKVQLDCYSFKTVVTMPTDTSYNTDFSYFNTTTNPAMNITALEVDANDNIVNGMQAPMTARTKNNMTQNITFPGTAPTVNVANVKVNFPAAGVMKGGDITQLGNAGVNDVHIGNALVVKSFNNTAEMFVGVGNATLPSNNVSDVKIQSLSGADIAPDFYQLTYQTTDMVAFVRSYTITDGAMFNIGQVDTLDGGGTTLDDTTFATSGQGYDASGFIMYMQNTMGGNSAVWNILAKGGALTKHNVPHLPAKVKLADLTGGAGISLAATFVSRYKGGSPAPWSETTKSIEVEVSRQVTALDPGNCH